ncbi:Phosphatidate cytidylyltransferase [Penicillium daleae]|uniref:Phosphatidate cytidylyltransferase, mitochondrial n=1 Tax=Penicillium daleae TaxID=63821 RepID=A0AAD6G284_9EURO|nr:Phosphatidate cytidylyltransferase [Penicillium daleae]KAJ5450552.1 Phosphatidate cytidylyltransferase [Penicillium daleae]
MASHTACPSLRWKSRARFSPLPWLPTSVRCISIQSRLTSDAPFYKSTQASGSTSQLLYNVSSGIPSSAPFSTSSHLSEADWDHNPNLSISNFSELPSKDFGVNQHMIINQEFKEALRQILWQFRAPIRYAFAYGSGVFTQTGAAAVGSTHPSAPAAIQKMQQGSGKMIDFIFGVSYSQHWHDLNLHQHRDHYSGLGSLGSYVVSQVQDQFGAGVYFNTHITVNGTLIKYGVVNLDTLCTDLTQWNTLYLAGRLHKPVKILRDHPKVRLANQMNLLSALRVALLLLPERFSEFELYSTIAGISYMGDLRMVLPTEDPGKVRNIVSGQMAHFRRLYAPLISNLPNVTFQDPRCSQDDWIDDPDSILAMVQDMDPVKRGNMVRRLPESFRQKLYFQYQSRFAIPRAEFNKMMEENDDTKQEIVRRPQGGPFERRIADDVNLQKEVSASISKTIRWPSTVQTIKGTLTAGVGKSLTYLKEKREKHKKAQSQKALLTEKTSKSEKTETVEKAEQKKD